MPRYVRKNLLWTPAALVSEFLVACQVEEDEDAEADCGCRGDAKLEGDYALLIVRFSIGVSVVMDDDD
jgi:hypothetical protein